MTQQTPSPIGPKLVSSIHCNKTRRHRDRKSATQECPHEIAAISHHRGTTLRNDVTLFVLGTASGGGNSGGEGGSLLRPELQQRSRLVLKAVSRRIFEWHSHRGGQPVLSVPSAGS